LGNKNPGALSYTGLLVVAGTDELSNLELLKDLVAVFGFIDEQESFETAYRNRYVV